MTFVEQIEPSSNLTPGAEKKVRGRNKSTIRLIEAMRKVAEETKPITGRGIGYKLLAAGLIGGMDEMPKVYRALVVAREDGDIPWDWIVDETRDLELIATWMNPGHCADGFYYRRDLRQTQPKRVEVWSEKGTVRGVIWPILARFGVGFRVLHGFNSATVHVERLPERSRRSTIGRPVYRRLGPVRHVHVGARHSRAYCQIRRQSRRVQTDRTHGRADSVAAAILG
jgi:hypothetical protein